MGAAEKRIPSSCDLFPTLCSTNDTIPISSVNNISLKTYRLDPVWYFTTPWFAWDCMLKMTKQKLELLTNYDMVLTIDRGIRGGISECSNRYAKVNNKYMNEKYDKSKKSVFIEYLDANSLYWLGNE
jgi:hypothetical protein